MKNIIFAGLFIFLGAVISSIGAATLSEVLENVQEKEGKISSIRFSFSQEIQFSGMESKSVVKGEAYFQKPKKLRIEKKEPLEQITISDGEKLWVYTPSYKQAWAGNWESWIKGAVIPKGLVPIGNFVDDLRKNFELSFVEPGGDNAATLTIKGIPKEAQAGYSIEIKISTQSYLPVQTIFHSETANIITTLDKVEENFQIPNEAFSFHAPHGTEIIKLN